MLTVFEKPHRKIGDPRDINVRSFRAAIQSMAASFLVRGDKVEMISRDVDPIDVTGESEAHQRPANILQLKFGLKLQSVRKPWIRLFLPRHASDLYIFEFSSNSYCQDAVRRGQHVVQSFL